MLALMRLCVHSPLYRLQTWARHPWWAAGQWSCSKRKHSSQRPLPLEQQQHLHLLLTAAARSRQGTAA
jgi:hypothetical protein